MTVREALGSYQYFHGAASKRKNVKYTYGDLK
jgi:hypothetical protein